MITAAFILGALAFAVQPWKSRKRETIALILIIVACCFVLLAFPEPHA